MSVSSDFTLGRADVCEFTDLEFCSFKYSDRSTLSAKAAASVFIYSPFLMGKAVASLSLSPNAKEAVW